MPDHRDNRFVAHFDMLGMAALTKSEPDLAWEKLSAPPAVVPAYASERGIDLDLLETARIHLELLYGEVAASWPGFIARPGQYKMMQACLLTFFSAKAPRDEDRPGDNLAQLEAGNLAFPGHAAQGGLLNSRISSLTSTAPADPHASSLASGCVLLRCRSLFYYGIDGQWAAGTEQMTHCVRPLPR